MGGPKMGNAKQINYTTPTINYLKWSTNPNKLTHILILQPLTLETHCLCPLGFDFSHLSTLLRNPTRPLNFFQIRLNHGFFPWFFLHFMCYLSATCKLMVSLSTWLNMASTISHILAVQLQSFEFGWNLINMHHGKAILGPTSQDLQLIFNSVN